MVNRQVDSVQLWLRGQQNVDHVLEGKGKGERQRELTHPHQRRADHQSKLRLTNERNLTTGERETIGICELMEL